MSSARRDEKLDKASRFFKATYKREAVEIQVKMYMGLRQGKFELVDYVIFDCFDTTSIEEVKSYYNETLFDIYKNNVPSPFTNGDAELTNLLKAWLKPEADGEFIEEKDEQQFFFKTMQYYIQISGGKYGLHPHFYDYDSQQWITTDPKSMACNGNVKLIRLLKQNTQNIVEVYYFHPLAQILLPSKGNNDDVQYLTNARLQELGDTSTITYRVTPFNTELVQPVILNDAFFPGQRVEVVLGMNPQPSQLKENFKNNNIAGTLAQDTGSSGPKVIDAIAKFDERSSRTIFQNFGTSQDDSNFDALIRIDPCFLDVCKFCDDYMVQLGGLHKALLLRASKDHGNLVTKRMVDRYTAGLRTLNAVQRFILDEMGKKRNFNKSDLDNLDNLLENLNADAPTNISRYLVPVVGTYILRNQFENVPLYFSEAVQAGPFAVAQGGFMYLIFAGILAAGALYAFSMNSRERSLSYQAAIRRADKDAKKPSYINNLEQDSGVLAAFYKIMGVRAYMNSIMVQIKKIRPRDY